LDPVGRDIDLVTEHFKRIAYEDANMRFVFDHENARGCHGAKVGAVARMVKNPL
jgi:hypothetical protein